MERVVCEGGTFWIELPLVEDPLERQAQAVEAYAIATESTSHIARVLYIEDNLSNLTLVERILAFRPGMQLLTAMQEQLGIDLAREHQPDLILLDMHLPDLDGGEVLHQLQANPSTAAIPVAIISADATAKQVDQLRAAGASNYLTKPFDVPHFLGVVDAVVQA